MSIYNFPEGVTWQVFTIVPLDFLPKDYTIMSSMTNMTKSLYAINDETFPDISYITDGNNMFYGSSFSKIPTRDYSKLTSVDYMFNSVKNTYKLPALDLSSATSAQCLFQSSGVIYFDGPIDLRNATNAGYYTFSSSSIIECPELIIPKTTSLYNTFYNCTYLKSIGIIHCDSITSISNIFGYSTVNYLNEVAGFKNLGAKSSLSGTTSNFLQYMPNLTKESVLNILNHLYDRASAGYSVVTLKMHDNHLAMLSDEEKAIATNKGWTLS